MPGYEVKFTHQLQKRHMCSICLFAMRNPVQTECGHLFCRDCLEPVLKRRHPICPLDKEEITQEGTFPDNACRREILKLHVNCQDCPWVGTLKDLEDHLSTCEYRDEQCTQCGQYIQHLNVSAHQREQCPMRPTTCPHCNKDVPIQQLQTHIDKLCKKLLEGHLNECDKSLQVNQQEDSEDSLESVEDLPISSSIPGSASSVEEVPLAEICVLVLVRDQLPALYLQHNQDVLVLPHRGQPRCQETQRAFADQRTEIVIESPNLTALLSMPGWLVLPPAVRIVPNRMRVAMAVRQLQQQQTGIVRLHGSRVVVWRISEVARLGVQANICLQSTVFYTAGYEAYLRLYVQGGGTGRRVYLSLFLVLMRRESELPPGPPFRQRADVQLIDDTTGQQLISKFIHHPQIIFSDGQALIPNTPGGACIVTLLEKYCVQRDIIFMLRVRL